MRVRQISVDGLFGLYNHIVPLNPDDRITILHGPNGVGKTALLKLIDGLFNARSSQLRSVPYSLFQVSMGGGAQHPTVLTVEPSKLSARGRSPKKSSGKNGITIRRSGGGVGEEEFELTSELRRSDLPFSLSTIEREIPSLERVEVDAWRYLLTNEVLSLTDVLERFPDAFPSEFARRYRFPTWFTDIQEKSPVRLIETQRLLSVPEPQRFGADYGVTRLREHRRLPYVPAVSAYAADLADLLQSKLAESASLSQSLDRSFPQRVIEGRRTVISWKELQSELQFLDNQRTALTSAGLLDEEQYVPPQIMGEVDETMRGVLAVYVDDTKKKLSVFDDFFGRLDVFRTMVDDRFLHKKLQISREKGFSFIGDDGKELPVAGLSSGEQHQLVLLYELIFKTKSGSLVMIDEPELSLHVAWQERFLSDMQEIALLSQFDALVATHSPQIIGNRWDLTVALSSS